MNEEPEISYVEGEIANFQSNHAILPFTSHIILWGHIAYFLTMQNTLKEQTSFYLAQHAEQPVFWQTWNEETLAETKSSDRPIFLSIGYAGSHWCQVMSRESFTDPVTAEILNERFCCIKVDREERPDLDKIYLSAMQLLTQHGGGWPLNLFIDPQTQLPFFAGTYFPAETQNGQPGFADLLLRLFEAYDQKREELTNQSAKLANTLEQLASPVLDPKMTDEALINTCRTSLAERFDHAEGGFGQSIKFAMPGSLDRLLRHWAYQRRAKSADKDGLEMVMTTLTQMARGGAFDHLGGGFFRYAQDRQWRIPHFEKVLYDNAQLLSTYAHALKLGGDALFEYAISSTLDWLTQEMRDDLGGFYAGQDGASLGQRGRHYLWRREQVKKLLDEDSYLLVETLYALDKPASVENHWILHRRDSWRSVIERLSIDPESANSSLVAARRALMTERSRRTPPITDKKVLTGWNGMLISGLVDSAQALGDEQWLNTAQATADFLRNQCWDGEHLAVCWQNGRNGGPGYLDDYANVLQGLLSLLQHRWRDVDATFAKALAETAMRLFYDADNGGFYFTAIDQPDLIFRPKPSFDEALPPGNATLASAMLHLGQLLGETTYLDAASNTLRWARAAMERYPANHCSFVTALQSSAARDQTVVIRGPEDQMADWRQNLTRGYQPWLQVYCLAYDIDGPTPNYLPGLISTAARERVSAFVFADGHVSASITDFEELRRMLGAT